MISARALLDQNPRATLPEIEKALSGNLCRCTGYTKIFEAVEQARDLDSSAASETIGDEASASG